MGVSPHLFGLGSLKDTDICIITDNLTYQLVSTCAAFYFPLLSLCIIYWKIFQAAKFRIRKKGFNSSHPSNKTIKCALLKKKKLKGVKDSHANTHKQSDNTNEIGNLKKVFNFLITLEILDQF